MDERLLVTQLLTIGVAARKKGPNTFAYPSEDADLNCIGVATLAKWLPEMSPMVANVEPCFTSTGAGFRFQVTDDAVRMLANTAEFDSWLNKLVPLTPEFDLFISYAKADADVAGELRDRLVARGLKCFMAEKEVDAAENWQESVRFALIGSQRVLILCTPESSKSAWVLMETGAAWALGKPLIPLLFGIDDAALIDPIRRHQARVIRTMGQREALVNELTSALRKI